MNLRNLLVTTAVVSLLTGAAVAQDATKAPQPAPENKNMQQMQQNMQEMQKTMPQMQNSSVNSDMRWLSSELTGKPVFASNSEQSDAIGEINDLVLSADGKIDAVIVGVGGFVGIGEKDVAIAFSDLKIETAANGETRIVVPTTKDALTNAEAFDRKAVITARHDNAAMKTETTATTDANAPKASSDIAQTTQNTQTTQTAPLPKNTDGTTVTGSTDTISADKLIGLSVYDNQEKRVGEIGDVILTNAGEVDAVIVDVGGFLGMGEKPVAIGFDQLKITRVGDNDIRLMSTIAKDKFETVAAYNKDEYGSRRGEMRVQAQ